MTVLCDECGKALNPNDDRIYYGRGAYCPDHHPDPEGTTCPECQQPLISETVAIQLGKALAVLVSGLNDEWHPLFHDGLPMSDREKAVLEHAEAALAHAAPLLGG